MDKKGNKSEHIIKEVYPDSIAEEMEIEPGDVLLAINDTSIQDVFDYRYLIKNEYIEVLIRKADGEEWLLEIDKDYDEDLGLEFDNGLMSEYRTCSNKCIFCFIDQMPPGMRETLYFKDDDSRLSFLQGNYITLTNMKMEDIQRIVKMHLAPINISIQSTNPELRCKMRQRLCLRWCRMRPASHMPEAEMMTLGVGSMFKCVRSRRSSYWTSLPAFWTSAISWSC